jgi:hypothetical protein
LNCAKSGLDRNGLTGHEDPLHLGAQTEERSMTAADPSYSRRWLILTVVGVAQVMVVLDTTVVNVALPSAQRALHFSNGDRQ